MRALVVGGAGFIGSHLVDRLLAEEHRVDVIDDLSTGSLANLSIARGFAAGALKFHHLDVRADELDELIGRREPEIIVHLAALPPGLSDRVALEVAIIGTMNLLEAACRNGVEKVVVALPAAQLYGDVPARELPVKEGRTWEPSSVRGVAARSVAELLGVYRAERGLEFTALALTNVYGTRQRAEDGVVARFAAAAAAGERAELHGDGRQTRDFVFIDDVVDAFVRAAGRGSGLVVNIGTGTQTTIRELHDLVVGRDGPAPRSTPRRIGETGRFAVSPVRARIHLAWEPWTALETGIEAMR
ncbi:MAG: NAD-dependent epimerase/dehydratase family protein [Acidimicrobiia bacterium]